MIYNDIHIRCYIYIIRYVYIYTYKTLRDSKPFECFFRELIRGCHGRIGFLRPGPGPAAATNAINHPFTGIYSDSMGFYSDLMGFVVI